jgi:hypothetical protein
MPVEKQLPAGQFDNVVRWVKLSDAGRLKLLSVAVTSAVERLGIKSKPFHAVAGIPAGSDQFDGGSVVEWMSKVEKGDRAAVAQIRALDATLKIRLGG